MNILLIEDDAALASALSKTLSREGFIVNHVAQGKRAITTVKTEPTDIVILDLGLPDMDGLAVLSAIRKHSAALPVLILTARSSIQEKVSGLDLGADDYLAKPFEVNELLARLRVFERRASAFKHSGLSVGEVALDATSYQASVANKPIELSRREFMLLKALVENAGRVLTRESLESKLYRWGEEVASNTIEVHIHHLRKKLPSGFIQTLRGVGYIVKLP